MFVDLLAELGWTPAKLAAQLGCSLRTVRRWQAGVHRPNRRNRAALRCLLEQAKREAAADPYSRRAERALARLDAAEDSLLTDAERARRAAFEERMRAKQRAIAAETAACGPDTYDQWLARVSEETRGQAARMVDQVDPFALCRDRDAEFADEIDAVFAA